MDSETKNLLVELERHKAQSAAARKPFDRDYWLNISFFLGNQYVRWGKTSGSLERIDFRTGEDEENTPRPVANKIQRYVNQLHALANQHDPQPEVLPVSEDEAESTKTEVGQSYLDDLASPAQADWAGVRGEANLWAVLCGEAWIKWPYDKGKGRPDVVACSPFEVYPDAFATNQKEMRRIIHSRFMSADLVYEIFGTETKELTRRDDAKATVLQELGYGNVDTGVTVNEFWELPSRRHPEGRYCVWAGRQFLVPMRPFPYPHKRLPFTQIGVIPVPGSIHMHSPVKISRPLQMELNQFHAQRIKIRKNFSNPKWFIDAELYQSMKEHSALPNNAPNQIMVGDSAGGQFVPQLIQPTAMADQGDGEWLVEEMADAMGLHDISQGDVPGRVESAKAIEMLKQEDASQLAMLRAMHDYGIAVGFGQCLELARAYVRDEIMVVAYSAEGAPGVRRFKADKLPKGALVRVASTSGLPKSRAAREEKLVAYWNAGIIDDKNQIRRLLELPYETDISGIEYDLRQATNENMALAAGEAVRANLWDNHELHRQRHDEYRKSAEFRSATDDVQQKFEFHMQEHDERELEELAKEAARQRKITELANAAVPVPPPGDPVAPAPPTDPASATPPTEGAAPA